MITILNAGKYTGLKVEPIGWNNCVEPIVRLGEQGTVFTLRDDQWLHGVEAYYSGPFFERHKRKRVLVSKVCFVIRWSTYGYVTKRSPARKPYAQGATDSDVKVWKTRKSAQRYLSMKDTTWASNCCIEEVVTHVVQDTEA